MHVLTHKIKDMYKDVSHQKCFLLCELAEGIINVHKYTDRIQVF